MGRWAQVQVSGSNFYAKRLHFSASDDSTTNLQLVTWDSGDKKLKTTGSYKLAGKSDPYAVNWFPYNGNVDIGPATLVGDSPKLRLRTRVVITEPSPGTFVTTIVSSSNGDGRGRVYFLTDGTSSGADIDDYTLRINRNDGTNSAGNIVAKGTNDFKFEFKTDTGVATDITYKKIGDFTDSITQISGNGNGWSGLSNLETTSGTNNASIGNGTYGQSSLIFIFGDIYSNFSDLEPDSELLGCKFLIRDRVDNGVAYVTWSFIDPTDNITRHELRTYSVSNTSNAIRYIPGGSGIDSNFDNWGQFPQPGNNAVYVGDFINSFVFNTIRIEIDNLQVSSGAATNYRIAGGNLAPRLAFKIKTNEGKIIFRNASATSLLSIPTKDGSAGNGLKAQIRGVSVQSPNQVKVVINGNEFEWVYQFGSTRRIKTNIQNYAGPLLDNFDKLRPVTFNYTNRTDSSTFGGFIAEEIAEISPSSVIYGKNYETVNGALDINSIIDDTLVPHDIKDRDIMAAAVAKLNELDKKLKYL